MHTYRSKLLTWSLIVTILTTILAVVSLFVFSSQNTITTLHTTGFIAAIGLIHAVIVAASIHKAIEPAEDMASALAHINPHAESSTPPHPRSKVTEAYMKTIFDLSTQAQSEQHLTNSTTTQLATTIDMLPAALFTFSTDQILSSINTEACKLLGMGKDQTQNISRSQLLDWQFQTDQDYDMWLDQCRGNKIHSVQLWERVSLTRTDGERRIGDVVARYEKESPIAESYVLFIDRTSQYIADEAQLDFVAVAAHELRGPITVIRGYLDVMHQEMSATLTVEQQALMQKMTVSAEMLSLYVNNILNVARVDQKGMKLHIVKSNWADIMRDTFTDLSLRAQVHGRILKLEMEDGLPEVGVDRVGITEVINNLVDNAIKYSSEGGTINIRVRNRDGLIETTVQDFGIGIPDSVIGNLFTKFYRSHKTKAGVTGTGLGLYLCKAFIDGHGGNIWVRSKEGEGSTFGFDLPSYDTIAESLKKGDTSGVDIKRSSHGWIKNHAMIRE